METKLATNEKFDSEIRKNDDENKKIKTTLATYPWGDEAADMGREIRLLPCD